MDDREDGVGFFRALVLALPVSLALWLAALALLWWWLR